MKSTVITPAGALSRANTAKYLSCSTRQVDKLAKAGKIPRLKIGAKTVYRPADLDAYLASCIQSPSSSSSSSSSDPFLDSIANQINAGLAKAPKQIQQLLGVSE